ncbi:MAG: TonB-dependent receptor, partial [Verrucomicrobia bacterium]|nr:TonB-dependent receptor [Verrucomicrobiota bacterium]
MHLIRPIQRLGQSSTLTLVSSVISTWFGSALFAPGQESAPSATPQALNPIVVQGNLPAPQNQTIADEITINAANLRVIQSRQEIERYPEVRLGESIKRLPGVGLQYNIGQGLYASVRGIDPNLVGVTFGGVRMAATDATGRHVSLNQIPNSLVSQIILTESNTPDQDAEALGGTIELTPRSAFDATKSFVEGRMGSGFYTIRPGYPIIDGSITAGTIFGFGPRANSFSNSTPFNESTDGKGTGDSAPSQIPPSRPFGLLGTFTYYDDHRGVENFQATYDDSTPESYANKTLKELDFYDFTFHRRTYGYGGTFDFRPDDNNRYYVSFIDGGYVESNVRYGLNLLGLNTAADETSRPTLDPNRPGYFQTTTGQLQSSLRYKTEEHHDNQVLAAGGHILLGPAIIDFRGSFVQGYSFSPLDSTFNFTTPNNQIIAFNNSGDSNRPSVILSGSPKAPDPFDINQYKFSSLTIDRSGSTDTEYAGALNVTWPLQISGFDSAIKVGTNLRFRKNDRFDDPQTYSSYNGPSGNGSNTLTLADVAGSTFHSTYDGFYPLGYSPSQSKSVAFINGNLSHFVRNTQADRVASLQAFFNDSQNIYAGYGQFDITLGKLNLLAGARIEATESVYGANANAPSSDPKNPASYGFVNRSSSYANIFPSFQAKYQFTDCFQARFAYSTAIGRPTFGQATASTIIDRVDRTIVSGNPDLKPITDNSFDLAVDFYPVKGSLFSIGIFDKEIASYIFQRSDFIQLQGVSYTQTTFLNSGTAYSRGIDLNYQQEFWFLRKPFSGLGI